MNKKKIVAIVAGGVLLFALLFSIRGCRELNSENAFLKGREAELVKIVEEKDMAIARIVANYEERIAAQQGYIDSANTVIVAHEGTDKELAEKNAKLRRAEATIQDKDELITNLRSQIETWGERFTLAQQIIEEKDKIIFSLKEQYALQVKITLEKDGQILSRDELIGIKDMRIAGLESELKKQKYWGAVNTWLGRGAIVYVIIDLAKGFLAR